MHERVYRSARWFAKQDKDGFIHRSWVGRGLPEGIFDGRPIIGICNTWSDLTPCNAHFRQLAFAISSIVYGLGAISWMWIDPVTPLERATKHGG